jgi:hypothetical protein
MIPVEAMQSELVLNNNRVARRALERLAAQEGLGRLETFCVLQRVDSSDTQGLQGHLVGYEPSGIPVVDEAFELLLVQDIERSRGVLETNRLVMVALFGGVNVRWIPVPDAAIGPFFRVLEGDVAVLRTVGELRTVN